MSQPIPATEASVAGRAQPRIVGLDVARALALFGMFAAHIGSAGIYGPGGWRWLVVTHGRASALFAVLAGVSISLMLTRRAVRAPAEPDARSWTNAVRHTRIRVTVRGIALIVFGWALAALATPVDVILDNLGVMFLLALVAMRWGARTLIIAGVAILAVGRALLEPLVGVLPDWLYNAPVLHELWGVHYPALVWIGYVLVGMGLGRVGWRARALWRGRPLAWLAIAGAALALAAYGVAAALLTAQGTPVTWVRDYELATSWLDLYAHSYSAFEMLGNLGVACLVIAACCALANVAPRGLMRWFVGPLAAAGAMTLTLYSAHVVIIAIAGSQIVFQPSNLALVALCAGCIAFAVVWKRFVGQGPMERLLSWWASIAADEDARRRADRS